MSSQYPLGDQEKRGIRQTIHSGAQWLKNAVKRPSSARLPSGNPGRLSTPSIGSQNPSLSRPTTPLLVPAPPSAEMDRRGTTPPPGPPTHIFVLDTEAKNVTESNNSDGIAWSRLTSTLRRLESCVDLFPPLKSAVSALIGCLDIVQKAASNRADYEELADEFQVMANMLNQYAGQLESEPNNGSIANIAQSIQQQVTDIQRKRGSGTVGRRFEATDDQEDVIRRYRQVEKLFRQLQFDLSIRTRNDVKKQLEMTLLQRMSPVGDAKYNSSYSNTIRRRGCTTETREAIHQTLQDWTMNPESEKIYWMNGMAGTGKTTIAYSFCEWLNNTNRLGGSFFCSRISSTCRSLSQIVPTLAYQLARFSPAFRSRLCAVLNDDPDAGQLNVVQQFDKLIYNPMLDARDAMPAGVVIVIDALDECEDSYSVRLLLDVLLKFAEQLPLKFLVSSRPEPLIRGRMMSQGGASRSIVYLHDIEESIVEEDIKKYLTEALDSMVPPPPLKHIELLAKRSRNLFIYAATVVRYICPEDVHVDSNARLRSMLETIGDPKAIAENKYEDLDRLYTTVLKVVFNKRLDGSEKQRMQNVLWTVVCAREPMTVATIALLASLDEGQVWVALQSLRSVVHVPEDNSLISTLHASFPEYMLDKSRSKRFYCNESKSNETLAYHCFEVMKSKLKFNICEHENSYLTDDQVEDLEGRVARCISPSLSYACRYWSNHLLLAPALNSTLYMLLDFLSNRLLFWMEVLSLSHCIGIGALMMQQVQTWLQIKNNQDEIQKQVYDSRNFITWFAANPCSQSTPHIYVSALPHCAKSSWVHQHYLQHTTGLANISMSQHDETVLAICSLQSGVYSLAISPEGDRIATGSLDGSVWVSDIHTGTVIAGPFKGHRAQVYSVAFSPSGAHIASCSWDETIIIWDSQTGRMVTGPLHKHRSIVWSVAFSPDGKHLVSGSHDRTAIVWDTYTGKVVLGPLKGHSDAIYSVAYSLDGHLIASGSGDHTIRLWNASTGAAAAKPFEGHKNWVTGIAFSSDGAKLASCSYDKTIRVWDVKTGTVVGLPFVGHKAAIRSIAFSSDNAHIVSGEDSGDFSIMVWDTLTGLVVLGSPFRHIKRVGSVVFSPDNTRLVSCSADHTICIRDVQKKNRDSGQQSKHELSVGSVSFLPNHAQFISSSSSGVLHVWDMQTGTMSVLHNFEGQPEVGTIHYITVSSQGTLVAVSINDHTIRVWDVLTGKVVSQLLKGHQDHVRSLVFSPDGAYLCSGSDDTTIIIWNVEAGEMVGQPYKGHTGAVISVTYSPDGSHIASGATDFTVKIWDSSIGALVHTLNGHKDSISSVAFSPDGSFVISGSFEGVIRKWEVATGNCSGILFKSHPDPFPNPHSKPSTPVNSVSFSPDGTHVIFAFGSHICLVDAHTTKLISSELNLPHGEKVHWVGYSPNGTDLISVSVSKKADVQQASKNTQQSPQSPNIIRIWRAVVCSDQLASSSTPCDWSYKHDGRVMSPEGFVIWVPPDLIPHMEAHMKLGSESHYSLLDLSPNGFINIGDLCIGNRWTECYVSKD
ncbi:hypothetical protein RSAG8_08936, partial [Rhizoctonia solani AG-8 WAC10335]